MDENFDLLSNSSSRVVLSLKEIKSYDVDPYPINNKKMELFFVVEGRCSFKIKEQEHIDVEEGDILILKSEQSHQLISKDTIIPFHAFSVSFNIKDFINEEYIVFDRDTVNSLMSYISSDTPIIKSSFQQANKIQNLIYDMRDELMTKTKTSEFIVRSQLILILSFIVQYFSKENIVELKSNPHLDDIEKTIKYINEHLNDDISLDKLAEIAHMNRSYYTTVFKKITGMTTWEYILNEKIELAISLLLENQDKYNISEISEKCGFNNTTHFNKTFKKLTGTTPSEFKKKGNNPCFNSD